MEEKQSDVDQQESAEQAASNEERGRELSEAPDGENANDQGSVDSRKNSQPFTSEESPIDPTSISSTPPPVFNAAALEELSHEGALSETPHVVGSFNGASLTQVPLSVKPLSQLSSLLATTGLREHILSFLFQNPSDLQNSIITQGNELLKNLKEKYPELPATINDWKNLSPKQQAGLESKLPPGSLEQIKGVTIASAILEGASHFQTAAILDAGNAEHIDAKKPYFLAAPLQVGENFFVGGLKGRANVANRNMEEIESAVRTILELSVHKEHCLSSGARASLVGIEAQFKDAAATAEEAIQQFQKFAQIKTEPMNEADKTAALQCHREGLSLKNNALRQNAIAFQAEYNERSVQTRARLNLTPEDAELLKQVENLEKAAAWASIAANRFRDAAAARTAGNEKQAQALEQSAEYLLQGGEAYAAGTPESLEQANNFKNACERTFTAANRFRDAAAARTAGNEKQAQALEQCAEYLLQGAQTYAAGTPESLEQVKNFTKAYNWASSAANRFRDAAMARAAGNEKQAQALEQCAEYWHQGAQAYAAGTPESLEQANNLKSACDYAFTAADGFRDAATARTTGNEKQAQALEQSAEYLLQGGEAYAAGTPESLEQANNLEKACNWVFTAADVFSKAATARTVGNEKQAQALEQHAEYWLQAAPAYATGTPESLEQISNLEKARNYAFTAANRFCDAAAARAAGNEKQAQALEQCAEYWLQGALAYATGTPESLEQISNLEKARNYTFTAANRFCDAAAARAAGNEKQAQALEQFAECRLQGALAYATGTPESLEQADNLVGVPLLALSAADRFRDAAVARAADNEKQAQALEQFAEYCLQKAQARATGPPWTLGQAYDFREAAKFASAAANAIGKYTESARKADAVNNAAQATRCREAATFILDQLEKFGWIERDRSKRFEKIFKRAEKIANPPGCVVM